VRSTISLESDKKVPAHIWENKQIRDSGKMNVHPCPLQQDVEVNPRDVLQISISEDFPTYGTKKYPSYKASQGLFAHPVA
jgi:hypothetical protein